MRKANVTISSLFAGVAAAGAIELHVAVSGSDASLGTKQAPFRTIQHTADRAQPGDVITVHEGVYRERVNPPRGGISATKRITYQAAPGEQAIITGSEFVKIWQRVTNDTWSATIPNSTFGKFNPYSDLIHGDWFDAKGRPHHTGAVYLNGDWLTEAADFADVLRPVDATPQWFAMVDGVAVLISEPEYFLNMASFTFAGGSRVLAENSSARGGTQLAACSEGGQCVGYIRKNDWLRYDQVDFGSGTESVAFRAAATTGAGGEIELRQDQPDGELLGTCEVTSTGDWQKWQSFTAKIKHTEGKKNLCLVFKPRILVQPGEQFKPAKNCTVIYAQFPGLNPSQQTVEVNVRQTVFYPDQSGRNFITVRGFTMEHAATPWAPPTAEQIGLVGTHWSKGWIIENNVVRYSRCSGIALGKYGDGWDNRAESAEGYVGTLTRALKNGWNKAAVGSHIVRNNEISHCEQTGVVGSLGCAFSTVTGNDIHDIHVQQLFGGAEMAGIKFHGAIDVTISRNHIHRCGDVAGIWLDWMAQGTQVTGNLMHDNSGGLGDLFFEMQHGPILVANNILLSKRLSFAVNSQGIAFAHNLISGPIDNSRGDTRSTPYQVAHSTQIAGMYPAAAGDSGDHRCYNNLFAAPCSLHALDNSALPCFAAGNVFTGGAQPSKFDTEALLKTEFNTGVKLAEKPDGWYLALTEDKAWRDEAKRKLVTTELLGKARISKVPFANPDGSPLRLNTDYFAAKRDEQNPFPGPFEKFAEDGQPIKVLPPR